jgi:hypothetical protein
MERLRTEEREWKGREEEKFERVREMNDRMRRVTVRLTPSGVQSVVI